MSYEFNYLISKGLGLSAVGPTNVTYIGNMGNNYGVFDEPTNIVLGQLSHVSTFSAVVADGVEDTTPKAIVKDNTVLTWGANTKGELGFGNTLAKTVPVNVDSLFEITALAAAGEKNIYVIRTDGTLWGCGLGSMLGQGGASPPDKSLFIRIGTASNWIDVKTHRDVVVLLNSSGEVYTFANEAPVLLQNSISSIAVGGKLNPIIFTVSNDGKLYGQAATASYAGMIPGEDGNVVATPVQIETADTWASVYASPNASCGMVITTAGVLHYWGTAPNEGYYGLGYSNTLNIVPTIRRQSAVITYQRLNMGGEFVTALSGFNNIYVWGKNIGECIGIPSVPVDAYVLTPTHISAETNPYYAIINTRDGATDLLDTITGSVATTLAKLRVDALGDALLNRGVVSLKPFRASGKISTFEGGGVSLPLMSVAGNAVGGRLIYSEDSMKLRFDVAGFAVSGKDISGAITLRPLAASGYIGVGSIANGSVVLPNITVGAKLLSALSGIGTITLPALACYSAAVGALLDGYDILAMNKDNGSFSTHTGNSFASTGILGNKRIIGRPDGLFEVSGTSDAGGKIAIDLQLPLSDLAIMSFKHLRSAYIDVTAKNLLTVTLMFDTGESYSRTLGKAVSQALLETVQFVGKRDVAGHSMQVDLSLETDGKFVLNAIDMFIVSRSRRNG